MKKSILVTIFLFLTIICFAQTKDTKSNEKTKDASSGTALIIIKHKTNLTQKEVEWKKVDELEEKALNESIRNRGCRFDIKISPEDYLKYLNSPDPYTNSLSFKRSY